MYTTGSNERDKWLRRAIGELAALNEQITVEAIAAHLPPDFSLEVGEAEGMCADMGLLETTTTAEPQSSVAAAVVGEIIAGQIERGERDPDTGKLIEDEPPPQPKMTQQQANDAVLHAHNDLQEARLEYRRTQDATRFAKAALATSITTWQRGEKPYTREDMTRDFIRGSNEARALRAAQGIPPQVKQVGKSYIDRAAAFSRDNTPEGAARSRMKHGANRGAFPKSMVGRTNYDPSRGPVPKLPSER